MMAREALTLLPGSPLGGARDGSGALRLEAVALLAHGYFGCFHPSGPAPEGVLRDGLEILRPAGALEKRLAPVLLRSRHATVAAWSRGLEPAQEPPGRPRSIECSQSSLVLAGQVYPDGSEDLHGWCRRALGEDWRHSVGGNGAYTCVLLDGASPRIAFGQDRFGFFRQVYSRVGGEVWFATSTNALAAVPGLALELIPERVVALGVELYGRFEDSLFRHITRPQPNTGHRLTADPRPPEIHRGRGYFPREARAAPPDRDELVDRLNETLLGRLGKVLARPDLDGLGLWLTSGVDSRWIAAALVKLGAPAFYASIGTPGTLDFDTARQFASRSGVPFRAASIETLSDVADPLPETNWVLEGRVSLFYQFTGSLWEELRALGPLMLQGCFLDWLKWLLPKHAHRRVPALDRAHPLPEARQIYIDSCRETARKFGAELLFPGLMDLVGDRVAEVLEEARPRRSYDFLLASPLDVGMVERAVSLSRLAHALGGADAPLRDTAMVELALEATELPYEERRTLEPRCITALDPRSAELPSNPLSLPPSAMTNSLAGVAAHALRHPGWTLSMIRGRRRKTIFSYPLRMRLLGTPDMLVWARELLRGSELVSKGFGDAVEPLCQAILAEPTHKSVGFLHGLVSLELYARAWRRASRGERPYCLPLELPRLAVKR